MNYSFINTDKNKVIVPPTVPNAGIYKDEQSFSGKPWGNDYLKKKNRTNC